MEPALSDAIKGVMHECASSIVLFVFVDVRDPTLFAKLLLRFRIPMLLVMRFTSGFSSHQILFVQTVDVDAEVFPHESHTKRVGKPTNFEGLASHRANVW